MALPAPDFDNAVSLALGCGDQQDRDASFWGVSAEYSRSLGGRWNGGIGLAWDEETERLAAGPDATVETLTVVASFSASYEYNISLRGALHQLRRQLRLELLVR